MIDGRITVLGIRPSPESIGPVGNHLRWMFPARLGFPFNGFTVYRRKAGATRLARSAPLGTFAKYREIGPLKQRIRMQLPESVTIDAAGESSLRVVSGQGAPIGFSFESPVAEVQFTLTGPQGSPKIRAYVGSTPISGLTASQGANTASGKTFRIRYPFMTRVVVEAQFLTMSLEYTTEAESCEMFPTRDPVVSLPLPTRESEAIQRLGPKIRNRYASNFAVAEARYSSELSGLIKWLDYLRTPSNAVPPFQDPDAAPHELAFTSPTSGPYQALREVKPMQLLLAAATDPNIARFLSLYFVDENSKLGEKYDYKIEGHWDGDVNVRCGMAFDVGGSEISRPPKVDAQTYGTNQLPGIRFVNGRAMGRAQIRWAQPPAPETFLSAAIHPAVYDVYRRPLGGDRIRLTTDDPVLVSPSAWEQPNEPHFLDSEVEPGQYDYEVRGIDLFGQESSTAGARVSLTIEDLVAPPPPVRVRADLSQPGYPWRTSEQLAELSDAGGLSEVELRFEYGHSQHQQAPDVTGFEVFWRRDTLFRKLLAEVEPEANNTVKVSAVTDPDTLSPVAISELAKFQQGLLVRRGSNDLLPVEQRRRFRVTAVQDDTLTLESSAVAPEAGQHELVSDPHDSTGWELLELGSPLEFVPPAKGDVVAVSDEWIDTVAEVVERRSESGEVLKEILLERPILESGLFTGGVLKTDTAEYEILYSTRGSPSDQGGHVRLAVQDGASVAQGAQVTVQSPDHAFSTVAAEVVDVESSSVKQVKLDPASPPTARFKGGVAKIGASLHPILETELVPTDDGSTQALQIELDAGVVIAEGDALTLIPRGPAAIKSIRIQGQPSDDAGRAYGGDLAFGPNEDALRVVRVVSAPKVSGGTFELLVSVPPSATAPEPEATHKAQYFAPYVIRRSIATDESAAADLNLAIPSDEGSRTAFFAVRARDARDIRGPLSVPIRCTAVRTPPEPPGRPYPCVLGRDAVVGYATPPNRDGRATVSLCWDPAPGSGLRYEVSRALDASLVATVRRNWRLGLLGPAELLGFGLRPGMSLVWDATVEEPAAPFVLGPSPIGHEGAALDHLAPEDQELVRSLRGGVLVQDQSRFQIVQTELQPDSKIRIRVVPIGSGNESARPVTGPSRLVAPPDFLQVMTGDGALRSLAERIESDSAFALVTGTPVSNSHFLDEIPGVGSNEFYYRVRSVDSAGNRSSWSPSSAPFRQVDTTTPKPPRVIAGHGGRRQVRIRWARHEDKRVFAYELHRTKQRVGDSTSSLVARLSIEDEEGFDKCRPTPPIVFSSGVDLRGFAGLPGGLSVGPARPRIEGVFAVDNSDGPDLTLNALVQEETRVAGGRVRGVSRWLFGEALVVVLSNDAGEEYPIERRLDGAGPLVTMTGELDIGFPHEIRKVRGVYPLQSFVFDANPLDSQLAPNFVVDSTTTYNSDLRAIMGLRADLPDGLQVAVLLDVVDVETGAESLVSLRQPLGRAVALIASSGRVSLGPPEGLTRVVGVYKASDYVSASRRPKDYSLTPSSYDAKSQVIENVDPAVRNGTAVLVRGTLSGGDDFEIAARSNEFMYDDAPLGSFESRASFNYQLVALARTSVENVVIRSRPSRSVTVSVYDDRPLPDVIWTRSTWWDTAADRPATSPAQATAVRLEWSADGRTSHCQVFRRESQDDFKLVATIAYGTPDHDSGFQQFVHHDQDASALVINEYRVVATSEMGTTGATGAARAVQALVNA